MPRKHRRSRHERHGSRREFEPLESRLALSTTAGAAFAEVAQIRLTDRTLLIDGTDGPDRISVGATRTSERIRVVVGGVSRFYEGVGQVVVRAGLGDDIVRVGSRVTLPTRIDGGAGRDWLQAGSGPSVLLGGSEDDVLVGGGGRPALIGGTGRDRVVTAAPLGTLLIGPSAAGPSLRLLGRGYRLAMLGAKENSAIAGPIVVGVADLDNSEILRRVKASYDASQPVALVDATPDDAARFAALVGHSTPAQWAAGSPRAAMVVYRSVMVDGNRSQDETTVVMPRLAVASPRGSVTAGNRTADRAVLEHLTSVFSAVAPVADAPPGDSNLINLATSYVSKAIQSDSNGNSAQVINTVYGARSFLNQADFFYVNQEVDFQTNSISTNVINGITTTTLTQPASSPTILQPSPQTSMSTKSVTSGVSFNIGGSIGYNQMQGFNASVSAGLTISNSTTTTYPAIGVRNTSDLSTGTAVFGYFLEDATQGAGSDLTFYNRWIWEIPFTAYSAGQTSISFASASTLYEEEPILTANLNSTVPTPFGDTFALQPPKLRSLSTDTISPGETFKIEGSGFYPSLVKGVLIGGQALNPANFQVVSDQMITVIAPASPGQDQPVVVQTTQGVSNDDVTISISSP